MTVEEQAPRTRRALLGAALGGVAAVVARGIGETPTVRATPGQPLIVAQDNTTHNGSTRLLETNATRADTTLEVRATKGVAIEARNTASVAPGTGWPALQGISKSDVGLYGLSLADGPGVYGVGDAIGTRGFSNLGNGVHGMSFHRSGVFGSSGKKPPTVTPPNCGVYGWSLPPTGTGVGYGVFGRNDGAFGVFGKSVAGTGVHGHTKNGTGVSAAVAAGGSGRALSVSGRAAFRSAGVATVPSGQQSVNVTSPVPLKDSRVVATAQTDPGAGIAVSYVTLHIGPGTFSIHMTANTARDTDVAYFVIESAR